MKFFLAFALIATVASAAYINPAAVSAEVAEIQEIIAAIQSPSTNPATAAALEEILLDLLGVNPTPVAVGPAIIDAVYEPIAVGPAIVDFPLTETGEVIADAVAVPSPALVEESVSASAPLVQIILNINQVAAESSPIAPVAVADALPVIVADPVQVVESAPASPVQVVEAAPVAPVQVVEITPVAPVQVVEVAPVAVEPVVIGTPVIPSPAVVLPEQLN